ncbi:hypothetical protein GCM10010517_53580 [Streptosporangium fragile]|uniref:Uncharacterized protein n=1 Tax=Streptosporangium fragile TaxID=46186 RepID=A0ABP6IJF3_9ACTN
MGVHGLAGDAGCGGDLFHLRVRMPAEHLDGGGEYGGGAALGVRTPPAAPATCYL